MTHSILLRPCALLVLSLFFFVVACDGSNVGVSDGDADAVPNADRDAGSGAGSVIEDIPYAPVSDAQRLDLYLPAGEGPFPVVLLVHGGGFFTGDKAANAGQAERLVGAGIAAAAVNYRLSSEATFPAAVHDLKAAVRFLRAEAATYGLDPARVGAWGESAGAHLAAMLGTSAGDPYLEDGALGHPDESSRIRATVAWFPPIDFLTMDEEAAALGFSPNTNGPASPESRYMGFPVQDDPGQVSRANPTTYLDEADGAFRIEVGDADPLIPYTQSVRFHTALDAAGITAELEVHAGAGHGGAAFDSEANLAEVVAFFEAHL